jgi:asparagine synthase (glutamine-hydrolysing)
MVERLLAALAHRGGVALPDDARPSAILQLSRSTGVGLQWNHQLCALGALRSPHVAALERESQPVVDTSTGCALVWDGRLDNREQLTTELEAPSGFSDAPLVLRAYLHWGEDCAARLLGDFVFAVWDPRSRSCFVARDVMGVRPLFYSAGDGWLCFASEVQALLALPGISDEPDDVMMGEALLWWSSFPQIERTFYRQVRRLPPAHWLRWRGAGLEIHRYWDIDPRRELAYPSRQEYRQHFRELLVRAVARRMRLTDRAVVLVSGGADSSAVLTAAARVARDKVCAHNYQLLDDPSDESPLAEAAAREAGVPLQVFPLAIGNVLDEIEPFLRPRTAPLADLNICNQVGLLVRGARAACDTMLTGDGSDELFVLNWSYPADLFRTLQWGKLLRDLPPYARYLDRTPAFLLRQALRYAAPRPWRALWKRLKWRKAPPWVHPDFARHTGLLERLRQVAPRRPFPYLSVAENYEAMMRGRRVIVDEVREQWAARVGVEYRYPYYDREMLEFMYAVPLRHHFAGWRGKSFLYEEPELLPAPIRGLQRKADYGLTETRHWRAQNWPSLRPLFEAPPRRAAEYVHLPTARECLAGVLGEGDFFQRITTLNLAVFFSWLRQWN